MPRPPLVRRGRYYAMRNAPMRRARRRAQRNVMRGLIPYRNKIIQPVQYFKRTYSVQGWLVAPAGTDTFGAIQFTLNQLPNYTEFAQLYDQYKIKGVKVKLVPKYNSVDISSPGSTQLLTVLDYDDANAPTAVNDLLQYQNMKMTTSNRIHSRYLVPRCNTEVSNATLGAASAPKVQWIDCGYPTVLHHGIKYGVIAPAQDTKFDLYVTYYLAFKNVR